MKLAFPLSLALLTFTSIAYADNAPVSSVSMPKKFYIGVFGGEAWSNKFNVAQYGTAYYFEIDGGPLAVNAFGQSDSESSAYFGAQLGYRADEVPFGSSGQWSFTPGLELEGYSLNNTTFNANLVNNTTRLLAHNFSNSYPLSRTVFVGNAIFTLNNPRFVVHPYIGVGIGEALLRITGATATQTSPAEAGVNHYNSNPNASNSAMSGQIKLGVTYDFNPTFTVFADYRWLYIASTNFTFGSTVYSSHPETSSWQVNMDAQKYNMLDVGLRANL